MIPYETMIYNALRGKTPKEKYENLRALYDSNCESCIELTAQEGLIPDCGNDEFCTFNYLHKTTEDK